MVPLLESAGDEADAEGGGAGAEQGGVGFDVADAGDVEVGPAEGGAVFVLSFAGLGGVAVGGGEVA